VDDDNGTGITHRGEQAGSTWAADYAGGAAGGVGGSISSERADRGGERRKAASSRPRSPT